jgi:hypothetical protein
VSGFGRVIALWRFIAVQQFRAGSDIDLCREVLIAELAMMACSMQFALPNRTTFPATREAGWNCPARLSVCAMFPRAAAATLAAGMSTVLASAFLSLESQAVIPIRTGNTNPVAITDKVGARIAKIYLFVNW